MKRFQFQIVAVLLLAVLLAACGGADDADGPPEIRYGQDVCEQCKMIISEPRFASAYATEAGDVRRFDDIGEMFLYAGERAENVRAFWVHDFSSEKWIEASSATFVHDSGLSTPMGWGIAAFADREAASAYVEDHGGDLFSYDALREQVENGSLTPPGMTGHDHDHDHKASQVSGAGEHAE